ncbi:MAG: hypothetical protein JEZ06_10885 [Anaerolineaceae bacterium]|nr:hypothetical protein [Anaerolineaceae bacterium]
MDKLIARAQNEDVPSLVQEAWTLIIAFAREKPYLFRLIWVLPEETGLDPEKNRQQQLETINQFARLLALGMEKGDFKTRDPYITSATVLGIINMPFMLFYSGKLSDTSLRDRMVEEVFSAAVLYLKGE